MYKKAIFTVQLLLLSYFLFAQEKANVEANQLILGGYGEFTFNKKLDKNSLAYLDVPRFVLTGDYSFSGKTRLFSEIEFEHVKEVYVEQLWVQHKLHKNVNFRAGLLLVPVGIINEYHEPNTFNSVNRPLIDKYVVPTTWREIGAGFSGNFASLMLKYQVYVLNGFNGFDGVAHLGAQYPLRKARQKGAESFMSSPNFVSAIEFYGLPYITIGMANYFGKSQTLILENSAIETVDSSRVGINLLSFNSRVNIKALEARVQVYGIEFSNSAAYNEFAGYSDVDYLAKQVFGFYFELAYNVLNKMEKENGSLILFSRFEEFDTQYKMENDLSANSAYHVKSITNGLSWKPNLKIAFKVDIQNVYNDANAKWTTSLNLGTGFSF
ncbi:MAG: hypothetical protein KAI79_01350 [Bacteroidales bacterium]|nr:hypothetical protein [Bacteroidales bacterium]